MNPRKPLRGRPKTDPKAQRTAIIEATIEILMKLGYQKTTTLAVAKASGTSKETIYSHFPSKKALFEAIIRHRVVAMNADFAATLDDPSVGVEVTLTLLGRHLIKLLAQDQSIAFSRAAVCAAASQDLTFSKVYIENGREVILPKVAEMLEHSRSRGEISFDDAYATYETFFGLLFGDLQLRLLLGVAPPLNKNQITRKVNLAVGQFMKIFGSHC